MSDLTHLDEDGAARMVDVGAKAETHRVAIASGRITMGAEALAAIRQGDAPKGDVLGTVGNSGIAGPTQLHFEIRRGSDPLDPMLFLAIEGS